MKKVSLHCNNPKSAIHSKSSTQLFKKYVDLFQDIDAKMICILKDIYHQLKQGNGISEHEYNLFSIFLRHKDSSKHLNYIKKIYIDIPEGKGKAIEFNNLYIYLQSLLCASRAIHILQRERYSTPIKEVDGREYIGIQSESKKGGEIYLEILEEYNRYYICTNLRSGKNNAIYKENLRFCYESMSSLQVNIGPFPGTIFINKNKIIHPKGTIHIQANDPDYYEDQYFYYIIDGGTQSIHRIDKKNYEINSEGTESIIIKARKGKYIIAQLRNDHGDLHLYTLTGTLKLEKEIQDYTLAKNGDIIIANNDSTEEIIR